MQTYKKILITNTIYTKTIGKMDNTKFTKGKWVRTNDEPFFKNNEYNGSFVIKNETRDKKIVEVHAYSFWNLTLEEAKANALLISKAPELLQEHIEEIDRLQELLSYLESIDSDFQYGILDVIIKKKKLIKEATEL